MEGSADRPLQLGQQRLDVGELLYAKGHVAEARAEWESLYQDRCLLHGPDDVEARELADLLDRLA